MISGLFESLHGVYFISFLFHGMTLWVRKLEWEFLGDWCPFCVFFMGFWRVFSLLGQVDSSGRSPLDFEQIDLAQVDSNISRVDSASTWLHYTCFAILSINFDVGFKIMIRLKFHKLDFKGFDLIYNIIYFGYDMS